MTQIYNDGPGRRFTRASSTELVARTPRKARTGTCRSGQRQANRGEQVALLLAEAIQGAVGVALLGAEEVRELGHLRPASAGVTAKA